MPCLRARSPSVSRILLRSLCALPAPQPSDSLLILVRKPAFSALLTRLCRLRCLEAPDEPPTVTVDQFKTIGCNITVQTNFMHQGITEVRLSVPVLLLVLLLMSLDPQALTETIDKQSPSLGRTAQYEQKAAITRLPSNLVSAGLCLGVVLGRLPFLVPNPRHVHRISVVWTP